LIEAIFTDLVGPSRTGGLHVRERAGSGATPQGSEIRSDRPWAIKGHWRRGRSTCPHIKMLCADRAMRLYASKAFGTSAAKEMPRLLTG